MSAQDEALTKIRRLLKLGTSSNEHEARLALAKAAELARKHAIDLGCVKAEEEKARVIENTFESRMAFDAVEKAASTLCMCLFNVRCIFGVQHATYVGIAHNVDAARFAHAFVIEQCGRDLKTFKKDRWKRIKRRVSKGAAHQYCMGWAAGVHSRYQAEILASEPEILLENSKSAIVLRDQEREVSDYMQANHGAIPVEKSNNRFRKDGGALLAGYRDGGKVSINRPLSDGQASPRLTDAKEVAA